MRRFARWVSVVGNCDHARGQTFALVEIARSQGMLCIEGFKPGMHYWHEIGLFGTHAQMKAVEAAWLENGHEVRSKKPSGALGLNLTIPKQEWVDQPKGAASLHLENSASRNQSNPKRGRHDVQTIPATTQRSGGL